MRYLEYIVIGSTLYVSQDAPTGTVSALTHKAKCEGLELVYVDANDDVLRVI